MSNLETTIKPNTARFINSVKNITMALALLSAAAGTSMAGDQTYQKTRLPDAKGNQAHADVVFSDTNKAVEVTVAGHVLSQIPYSSIDAFSYDYARHHRITQGAVVMVASVGVGAVVMLTQSKSHFLTIQYHDGSAAKELVLRMDKSEYAGILKTIQAQTGRQVEFADRAQAAK